MLNIKSLYFICYKKSIISVWMLDNDFQDKLVKRHWFCKWRYKGLAKLLLPEKPLTVVSHPEKLYFYPRSRVWLHIWVTKSNVLNLELETVFNQHKSWSLEHIKTGLTLESQQEESCLVLSMNQPSILMLRLLGWITNGRDKE